MDRRRMIKAVLLALADVVVALLAAHAVFWLFGAWSGIDTDPPVCYSGTGRTVPCGMTPVVVLVPTFVVVLGVLAVFQAQRSRR